MPHYSVFDPCNHTELYQLCRTAGMNVQPNETRENMISYLEGTKEFQENYHPVDDWRDAIMKVLLDHWTVMASQLTCPAKSGDPKSCFRCVDAQVIGCLVSQSEPDQKLISLRRSK
jgi:hypothetical protein